MTNGLSNPYHLDEATLISRVIRSNFSFHFSMKLMKANIVAPDGTPRFAASHLGLFYLTMSNKKDARLIWVNRCKKISTNFFRIGPYLLYQTAFCIENYTRIHGERLSAEVEHA